MTQAGIATQATTNPQAAVWPEVLVVLSITAIPYFLDALLSVGMRSDHCAPFMSSAIRHTFQSMPWIVPVLYFMARSPGGLEAFGITDLKVGRDLGVAVLLLLLCMLAAWLFWVLCTWIGLSSSGHPSGPGPLGAREWVVCLLMLLANSIAEEFVMRSYLITRLEGLLNSTALAIVVSSMAFASYHFYQGALEANSALMFGMIMGASFCKLRRIWPMVLAHTGYNILVTTL